MKLLLTVAAASSILGLSPQTLTYRIERGDLRVARRNPLRVHRDAVLAYAKRMPVVRPYGGRRRIADVLARNLTSKLALLSQAEAHAANMKWS